MKAVKRHKVTTKCAAAEGALRNSKKATSGPEKHLKFEMWVLSVVSHRHSSSVCFSFISTPSAAGGVGRLQVVADDLARSGEAARGSDPDTADDCRSDSLSPSAASSF